MPAFGFMGPGYATRGLTADCQRWVNLYLEHTQSGNDASPGQTFAAYCTPGKQLLVTLADAPVACIVPSTSALPITGTTNLFFAVSGATLYAITATFAGGNWTGSATTIGTVASQAITGTGGQLFPAQILVMTPTQLFVVAAGNAYVAAFGSAISSSIVSAAGGGAGYAAGDTGRIPIQDGIPATYVINTVSPSGAVLTYTLTYNGTGFSVTTGVGTEPDGTQPGVGIGFTIDVTAVAAAAWLVQQQVIPEGVMGNFIRSATWQDGYVIVSLAPNEPDPARRQFFISGLYDPTFWNALEFDTKEANPDPVMAVYSAYEILIVFGSQSIELWQNSGDVLSTFQRIPGGGVIENGMAAATSWAACKMDGTVVWLGSDARGQYVAWQLRGTTPTRISNHAIENAWRDYDTAGASVYSYVENGHFFACFHFPIPDKTWVYDSTIGPALGWHERMFWDGANEHADIGRYHAFYPEIGHAVGDYRNGNVYLQSLDFLQDNCAAIRRERVSPHVCTDQRWNYFNKYRLHCLTGRVPATGNGSNPQCTLEISNDGANTYGAPQLKGMGLLGEYDKVVEWLRVGRARNRVIRWRCDQPIDIVLVDMYAEAEAGNG